MINKTGQNILLIDGLERAIQERSRSAAYPWLKALRENSLERFQRLGLPTVKDEDWKYTNIAQLSKHTFELADNGTLNEREAFERYTGDDRHLLVFVNGLFQQKLSKINPEKGLTVIPLQEALRDHGDEIEKVIKNYESDKETAFIALNHALLDSGCFIKIDKKAVIKSPIHICHVTSSSNGEALTLPRSIIVAGESSQASIMESHVAFDDKIIYFANALTDIYMGQNSTLTYCKAQKESLKAFHIGHTRAWLERGANLKGFSFVTGGAITRNNLEIILNGEGCNATLDGLYSIYDKMHTDNHTCVDHRYPNCTSNQLYKGILNEASRAVFNGKIIVRSIAQLTNSYQLNKNLLIGKDCRVDTKPQLEIFADDVKCTHGATIGQLDEDELFYLQARGISHREAMSMLSRGFVDHIVNTVTNESINRKLHILLEPSFERF